MSWRDRARPVSEEGSSRETTQPVSSWRDRARPVDQTDSFTIDGKTITVDNSNLNPENLLSLNKEDIPQDLPKSEIGDIGSAEAFLLGSGQGFLFGGADEALGAASALGALASGVKSRQELLNKYRQSRDSARERMKAAEEQQPTASAAGTLAGGLATTAIPGLGAIKAVGALSPLPAIAASTTTGALSGLLSAAGYSEKDYIDALNSADPEKRKEILDELRFGAETGGALGALLPIGAAAVAATGKSLLGIGKSLASPFVDNFKSSVVGKSLGGPNAVKESAKVVRSKAQESVEKLQKTFEDLVDKKSELLKKAGEEGKTVNAWGLVERLTNPKKLDNIPYSDKKDRLRDIKKLQDKKEGLIKDYGLDADGRKLYESLQSKKQKLTKQLQETKELKNNADVLNYSMVGSELDLVNKSLDELNETAKINLQNLTPEKANKLRKSLNQMSDLDRSNADKALQTDEALSILRRSAKNVAQRVKAAADTKEVDQQISSSINNLRELGIDRINESEFDSKIFGQLVDKIENTIRRSESLSGGVAKADDSINAIYDTISLTDPLAAENLKKQMQEAAKTLALAERRSKLSKFSPTGGLSLAGDAAGTMIKPVYDALKPIATIPSAIKRASTPIVSKTVAPVKQKAMSIYNNSPEEFRQMAESAAELGGTAGLYLQKKLLDISKEGNQQRKRALIHSVMQLPYFRKYYIKDTED